MYCRSIGKLSIRHPIHLGEQDGKEWWKPCLLCLYHPQTYTFHGPFGLHLQNGSSKIKLFRILGL